MNIETYMKLFDRTLSNQFHPEHVDPLDLDLELIMMINHGNRLDLVKKALFYNKPDDSLEPNIFRNPFKHDPYILHAILGVVSEACELTEVVQNHALEPDHETLRSRVVDEGGDLLWFLALLFKTLKIPFEEALERNIEKLRTRYPDGFTEYDAAVRDLDAENRVFLN